MSDSRNLPERSAESVERPAVYQSPTVTDHGSLAELTLSGSGPLSDGFGASATSGGSGS